jgi:hypothetical protein
VYTSNVTNGKEFLPLHIAAMSTKCPQNTIRFQYFKTFVFNTNAKAQYASVFSLESFKARVVVKMLIVRVL